MRASAPLAVRAVALIFLVALTGCATKVERPDARVALAVERADETLQVERKALELTALASADDDLPAAPAAEGARTGTTSTDLASAIPAGAGAQAADGLFVTDDEAFERFFPAATKDTFRVSSPRSRGPEFAFDDADDSDNARSRQGKQGLPNLRFELFRLTLNGQPVGVKCSIKNKFLMFGMKIPM
jgi:hypothetical protein